MRWQAPVVFLFLSCDRSQHRHDVSCMGSSEEIVRTVSQVKAAPRMQSQREKESQHRAASARHAFRALSAGGLCLGPSQQKDRTLVAQPASQREPCMAQEHGRNTLSARAKTINAAKMASFRRIVSTRFDSGEAPLSDYAVCQKLGIPTLASCTLLVFSNMALTGFGLSFNLRSGDNGVNVSSWTLSSWPRPFMTSSQT